jgi:hypothetical protein
MISHSDGSTRSALVVCSSSALSLFGFNAVSEIASMAMPIHLLTATIGTGRGIAALGVEALTAANAVLHVLDPEPCAAMPPFAGA